MTYPALDSTHTFTLTINGAARWAYVLRDSASLVDAQGGQVDTLQFDLEDATDTITVGEWQEVVWTADGTTKLFGGYVVKVTPALTADGGGRKWVVRCESYCTRLARTNKVRQTYINSTPGAIIADLFGVQTTLTDFDAATHVTAGPALTEFRVDGETLGKALDRLALLATQVAGVDWAWRVDADKQLWFGPVAADTAPFSIADVGSADYVNAFPPLRDLTQETDATDIRNRVTVRGGVTPSAATAEVFDGDGATVRFAVAHAPIRDIVRVTVGGVLQAHGTDWYDTFGGGYDCLINYRAGIVRWPDVTPPAVGTGNVVIVYRYDTAVTTIVTDAGSFAQYGQYFDYEVEDATITSLQLATDVADALLAAYAYGVSGGTFEVARLGLRAGQRVQIEYSTLGLTGYYIIQQATTVLDPGGDGVICTVRFGGRVARLSDAVGGGPGGSVGGGGVGGGSGGAGGYDTGTQPRLHGEAGILRVRDRIELLDPATTFTSEAAPGTATGWVGLYNAVSRLGKWLGYNAGVLQAYLDSDGAIKWGGGLGVLDSNGISIEIPILYSAQQSFKFMSGGVVGAEFWAIKPAAPSGTVGGYFLVRGTNFSRAALANITAHAGAGKIATVYLSATDGTTVAYIQITSNAGYQGITLNGVIDGAGFRHINLGNATADTDALNRITGDGRYAPIAAVGYLKTDGTIIGATAQAQALTKGVIGPLMTPDVVLASFTVGAAHTALYNNMAVPPAYTVECIGLLVDPGWS